MDSRLRGNDGTLDKIIHMNKSWPGAEVELEIPFHDTDPMAVAWHGHYLKYFEVARCALLRVFDYDYPQMQDSGYLWPVVEARLKYVKSAHYGQHIRVQARLTEYEHRLRIDYKIVDAETGARMTVGHTMQVAVDATSREMQFVSPPVLWEKIEQWRKT